MPVYVYYCDECGARTEVTRKMADDSQEVCECGIVMSRVPQRFRWYRSPYETLLDTMDKKHSDWKRKVRNGRK